MTESRSIIVGIAILTASLLVFRPRRASGGAVSAVPKLKIEQTAARAICEHGNGSGNSSSGEKSRPSCRTPAEKASLSGVSHFVADTRSRTRCAPAVIRAAGERATVGWRHDPEPAWI